MPPCARWSIACGPETASGIGQVAAPDTVRVRISRAAPVRVMQSSGEWHGLPASCRLPRGRRGLVGDREVRGDAVMGTVRGEGADVGPPGAPEMGVSPDEQEGAARPAAFPRKRS